MGVGVDVDVDVDVVTVTGSSAQAWDGSRHCMGVEAVSSVGAPGCAEAGAGWGSFCGLGTCGVAGAGVRMLERAGDGVAASRSHGGGTGRMVE